MKRNPKKSFISLIICLLLMFGCMFFADNIQTDGGNVNLAEGVINTELGNLTYKLYIPETATPNSPAPAVLLLHGYQNDHETSAAYAIELARRGVVVMALDEYGHGSTDIPMKERGFTNHKVTVNYGNDSESDGTFVEIGGQLRYRVMMNFSNLTFFNQHYSSDNQGNSITDSSMGGIAAYDVLSNMDFVDSTRMGISGHSMGTWASWSVAAAYSGAENMPKATVIQCGELFRKSVYDNNKYSFNNVLLLQAKYDEFSYFRDYQNTVTDDLLKSDIRTEFLGCSKEQAKWDTTYGSFDDGTARRIELLNTNHRLTTHNSHGMSTAMDWFTDALKIKTDIPSDNLVFLRKEWLIFFAMMFAIASMLPTMNLLLCTPIFADFAQALPNRPERIKKGRKWVKGAVITVLIAGVTYPFMTQLGHGLLPLPEGIFRMTIGNGFFAWYILLIIIMLITTLISWRKQKKLGTPLDYVDLGLGCNDNPKKISWKLCGKGALLSLCMLIEMYLLVVICEKSFSLDFRFIWPFFKSFSLERFIQFLVYIPTFAFFFLMNNSKIFAQMRVPNTEKPGFKWFLSCWWKYAFCMVGGILLLILLEYIPFFGGIGPGADLLFGTTFGGPFMSLMIVFVPQVVVFSVLCTYIYRRTGSVYVGAFTVASMAAWIVTGGSAIL